MIKYREMILNRDYGDFGLFALPQNIITSVLSVCVLFLMSYLTLKPVYSFFSDFVELGLQIFNFSFLTMSMTEYISAVYWSVLGIRYVNIVMLGSLFFISFVIAYLAAQHTEEKLIEKGLIPTFIYLAWYVFFTGVVWLVVIVDMITDAERAW